MTPERMRQLEREPSAVITKEEFSEGWHFCPDWDYMLVGPDTPEGECCTCDDGGLA